ncbi:MAG: lactate utilization protein [Clostridia bacterium]|nr:lactate utilization protein [Clostridia bacterium]
MNEKLTAAAKALEKRGFAVRCFDSAQEACRFVRGDIGQGASVAIGGSMTIREMKLDEQLREDGHEILWHWDAPPAERPALLHRALQADAYLCSANALTTDGLMVQIDGTGNRVGAMCYGPKTVYVVIGRNKLVEGGYQQAVRRIKQVACPANARRLGLDTPCAAEGKCDVNACTRSMCHLFLALEGAPGGNTTKVLLVDENLGY